MDIYVGSLPFKLKESELHEIFKEFGEVSSAKIVMNKLTRQSKGFGFVQMPDESQALKAIAALNDVELGGRKLIVTPSVEGEEPKDSAKLKPKETGPAKPKSNSSAVWTRKLYPKKKKEKIIDYPDLPAEAPKRRKESGKLAKNFKVGRRKKR